MFDVSIHRHQRRQRQPYRHREYGCQDGDHRQQQPAGSGPKTRPQQQPQHEEAGDQVVEQASRNRGARQNGPRKINLIEKVVVGWRTWLPPRLIAFAKNVHGAMPASTNSQYGTPPVAGRSTRANTAVKITMGSSGCRTAQSNAQQRLPVTQRDVPQSQKDKERSILPVFAELSAAAELRMGRLSSACRRTVARPSGSES